MDPQAWGTLILQTGAVGGLLLLIWASSTGKIRWEASTKELGEQLAKATTDMKAQYERQITQMREDNVAAIARMESRILTTRQDCDKDVEWLTKRNDELFDALKNSLGVARRVSAAADRATNIVETVARGQNE